MKSLTPQAKISNQILSSIDQAFLTLFVVEIGLKWAHNFLDFWKVGWNVFDFIIVAISMLGTGTIGIYLFHSS